MGLIFKAILCLGALAAMAAVKGLWLASITSVLRSEVQAVRMPEMKPLPKFDPRIADAIVPKFKLDPRIGQEAWRGTLNRQISQSINAANQVPRVHRPAGMPRF